MNTHSRPRFIRPELRIAGCVIALAGLAGRLSAQSAPAPAVPSPAIAAPAAGQTDDQIVHLPSFDVSMAQDQGYRAANSVSATRINTPIQDLPFSISAFTAQFISDNDARDLEDIVRYAAGVTNGSRAFNAGDEGYEIRGFLQYPEHDGVFEGTQGNVYVDPATIERVEVAKGPSSLLYGEINPGGTVNYITKRATPDAFTDFDVQAGSYSYFRATLDVNQPLGKDLLFRFNEAWENNFQYESLAKQKTNVFDPTLTWKVGPGWSATVNYSWFQRKENTPSIYPPNIEIATPASIVTSLVGPAYKSPSAALTGQNTIDNAELGLAPTANSGNGSDPGFLTYYPLLSRRFNTTNAEDFRDTDLESVTTNLDGKLGDHWVFRGTFDYAWNRDTQLATGIGDVYTPPPGSLTWSGTAWAVSPAWNALSATQQLAAYENFAQGILQNAGTAVDGLPSVIPRRTRWIEDDGHNDTVQADFAGDYKLSWAKIRPLVGVYFDQSYEYTMTRANAGTAAAPYNAPWDVDPASQATDGNLFPVNQNTPYVSPATLPLASSTQLAYTTDSAVYGVLSGSLFDDRVYFVGGARYNRSNLVLDNLIGANVAGVKGAHATTPQVGAGYKITRGLMLYASYSTAYFLPSSTALNTLVTLPNGTVTTAPTQTAVPTTGDGYEAGIKTDFLDGRIASTLSVYRIDEQNVLQNETTIVNGASLVTNVQSVEVRSQGIEFETTLSPTDNWQIFLSATEDDVRNTAEPEGYQFYLGAHPQGTAKTLANLWTRYSFTGGFWIGGGFNSNGRAAEVTSNPNLFIPAYTLWNSIVGYDWTWNKTKLSVALNWQNMTNVRYQPAELEVGLPERVLFSLKAHF